MKVLTDELSTQKEMNTRAPTTTMKNMVERLKNQLSLKEKQQQVTFIICFLFSKFCNIFEISLPLWTIIKQIGIRIIHSVQALSKALMELRGDMVQQAQDDVKAHAESQAMEQNVQKIVDKQTKELQVNMGRTFYWFPFLGMSKRESSKKWTGKHYQWIIWF